MKFIRSLLILMLTVFLAGKASSQLSIVIFSENGEKFTAYLNASPINYKPASRAESHRPGGPTFKVRIVFEQSSIPEITKTIFNTPGPDIYYVLRKSDNGKFIMEKTSSEYVHHNDNDAVSGGAKAGSDANREEKPKDEEVKSQPKAENVGGKGCPDAMSDPDFEASRVMISNAPFDGPKLTHAKSLADRHCLTTSQIIEVLYIFSGESTRLNFAKYAYKHCWDPQNYSRVKDVLHPSGKSELQSYIDSLK